jgi:Xaa-Pro aminopeptidase
MTTPATQKPEALANWPRLTELMAASEVDVLLAGTAANVTYLSDYWSLSQWTRPSAQAFAVARRGDRRDVHVIAPAGNADLVGRAGALPPTGLSVAGRFVCHDTGEPGRLDGESEGFRAALATAAPGRSADDLLIEVLHGLGAVTLAVEASCLTAQRQAALHAALPRVRLVSADPILAGARAVKTRREIDVLRRAAQITEAAIGSTFRQARGGWSERELQRRYLAGIADRDATPLFTALTTGERSALPNGQATGRVAAAGDLVRFDGGCRYGLYASDIARMAVVGTPTAKQRAYYAAVVAGLEAAIETAGPGVPAARCFDAAVRAVRAAGIRHYDRSHCGHGIGIENYDLPSVTPDSRHVLEPGMVICLETPYYELGWGGVQAEDTLLVTETGVERFTHQPAELTELR